MVEQVRAARRAQGLFAGTGLPLLRIWSGRTHRRRLFSLDGVHPTTIGYGILDQEPINVMQQHADVKHADVTDVKFYLGDGSTQRTGPVTIDFRPLIARDTLISDPPRSLTSNVRTIGWIDQTLNGVIGCIPP